MATPKQSGFPARLAISVALIRAVGKLPPPPLKFTVDPMAIEEAAP